MVGRRALTGLTVAAATATIALTAGCTFQEAICSGGSYPVAAVRSTTGRDCVTDGQEPPAGYVRFPDGKIPEHVDDDWDRYWSTHMLDEQGQELTG